MLAEPRIGIVGALAESRALVEEIRVRPSLPRHHHFILLRGQHTADALPQLKYALSHEQAKGAQV